MEIKPISVPPEPSKQTHISQGKAGEIWTTLSLKEAVKFMMQQISENQARMKEAEQQLKKSETGET